jgi:hypothetical protein
MIGGIFVLAVMAVVIGLAITGAARTLGGRSRAGGGQPVRGFFQYAVTYGLLIVVATGVSGLLGWLVPGGRVIVSDAAELARNLSFTVVGGPLLALMLLWTRRRLAKDPGEAQSPALGFFVMAATLTALGVGLAALNTVLAWAIGGPGDRIDAARALPQLLVWGGVWLALWRVHMTYSTPNITRVHHIIGSLVTGIISVVGLAFLVGQLLKRAAGIGGDALLDYGTSSLAGILPVVIVGLLGWSVYWLWTGSRQEQDTLWLAYVLLAGVGAGFVMVVASASTVLYRLLVWWLGDPSSSDARIHFSGTPTAIGVAAAGTLWWAHHRSFLGERKQRNEVVRVYEYLMSGISLVAAAVGLSIVVVAAIEALVRGSLLTRSGAVNTLLAATTLLAVGAPLWWWFWSRVQQSVAHDREHELASPTRRIYLYVLFGVGGIAAIVSLLVAVYQLFNDIISGVLGGSTVRDMRFALGVLVSTALIAAYHRSVFRHEREVDVDFGGRSRSVLLIGPDDHAAVREIAKLTGAKVQHWKRVDADGVAWNPSQVASLVEQAEDGDVVVVADPAGAYAIAVERR